MARQHKSLKEKKFSTSFTLDHQKSDVCYNCKVRTNSASAMLSKDTISNNDVAEYLESVNPSYDTLKTIKKLNTGKDIDEDYEIMDRIKIENTGIAEKLRNESELSEKEADLLIRTLENLLMITKYDTQHEFNKKGVEAYINQLKYLWKNF